MANYVLVHGGCSGGWVWQEVARYLRFAGHDVFTPTLTGLGERGHLACPDIDLNTHIQDIIGVLECEKLFDVVLVGHSSGSMVITGVAERMPEHINHLVYLDSAVPQGGQSWLDLLGPEMAKTILEIARSQGDGWRIPLYPESPRCRAHPAKPMTDRLEVNNPVAEEIPRTFIHCSDKSDEGILSLAWSAIDQAAEQAREKGWRYRELSAGHTPMQTMPRELADLLSEIA